MQSTSSEGTEGTNAGEGDTHAPRAAGLGEPLDELQGRLEQLNERVKGFIKERPLACLVGAMAVGYVLARLARGRR